MAALARLALILVTVLLLTGGCASRPHALGPQRHVPELTAEALIVGDGTALPLRRWLPGTKPTAVILALHGFNDYSNAFAESGRIWAGQGIATFAYDQRGFGEAPGRGHWPGITALQADLLSGIAAIRSAYPDVPVFVLGESMGGAVAATALSGAPLPDGVQGLILAAPAVWSRSTMPVYQRWALAVANWIVPGMVVTPPKGIKIQASDNIPMLVAMGRDPLVIKATRIDTLGGLTDLMDQAMAAMAHLPTPTLVLYGRHEQVIPPVPVARALARLPSGPGVRVVHYPDGWHMLLRDLRADLVRGDVAAFIADPAGPLPGGQERGLRVAGP